MHQNPQNLNSALAIIQEEGIFWPAALEFLKNPVNIEIATELANSGQLHIFAALAGERLAFITNPENLDILQLLVASNQLSDFNNLYINPIHFEFLIQPANRQVFINLITNNQLGVFNTLDTDILQIIQGQQDHIVLLALSNTDQLKDLWLLKKNQIIQLFNPNTIEQSLAWINQNNTLSLEHPANQNAAIIYGRNPSLHQKMPITSRILQLIRGLDRKSNVPVPLLADCPWLFCATMSDNRIYNYLAGGAVNYSKANFIKSNPLFCKTIIRLGMIALLFDTIESDLEFLKLAAPIFYHFRRLFGDGSLTENLMVQIKEVSDQHHGNLLESELALDRLKIEYPKQVQVQAAVANLNQNLIAVGVEEMDEAKPKLKSSPQSRDMD